MTTTQILQRIHEKYEGSVDYPVADTDDYDVRLALANQRIESWQDELTNWKELFTNVQDASDGDKTTVDNTTEYDCPTNFLRISSYVKINDIYYEMLDQDKVLETQRTDPSKRYFYLTGSPGSYKINLSHDPDGAYPIYYSYYKSATLLTTGSSVPEMSRPQFIINGVLADLYEQDNRNDMVELYTNKADESMEQMVIQNELSTTGQYIQSDMAGFGE